MKMERRKLRIGDLAEQLGVKRFVIRFWEKEFDMESSRSNGGQRHYDNSDYNKFSLIKKLLYEDRLTIEGAKKVLREQIKQQENKNIQIQASSKTFLNSRDTFDLITTQETNNNNKFELISLEQTTEHVLNTSIKSLDISDINNININPEQNFLEKILPKLNNMNIEKLIELQNKLIKLRDLL